MKCDRCGRDNPDHMRFCLDCGNRLPAAEAQPAAHHEALPANPVPSQQVPPAYATLQATALAAEPAEHVCASCGTHNPGTSRFCSACGAKLVQDHSGHRAGGTAAALGTTMCARCRGANPVGMRFCQFCGASLPVGSAMAIPAPKAALVVIGQDGTPGRRYPIIEGLCQIGRAEGSLQLANDPYVSPRHAQLIYRSGQFFIQDLDSLNGIFVRLKGPLPIEHGDLVLIGLEVLRFEVVSEAEQRLGPAAEQGTQVFGSPATPRPARLIQCTVEGVARDIFFLSRTETVIGREAGDIVFTSDPFMSRRHAAITRDPRTNVFTLRDLGSSNGTYLRIRGERSVGDNDHIRIGQHLFRLEIEGGAERR
ncbi:MAG TPA: FHA domain-containing protein [Polyangiaceae bacterium]